MNYEAAQKIRPFIGKLTSAQIAKELNYSAGYVRNVAQLYGFSLRLDDHVKREDYHLICALIADGMDIHEAVAKFDISVERFRTYHNRIKREQAKRSHN